MPSVVDTTDHFLIGSSFNRLAYSTGGTLNPNRCSTGKQPRSTGPPPMKSKNAGITMLSVLKIQPIRNKT